MVNTTTTSDKLKIHVDSHGRICAAVGTTIPKAYANMDDLTARVGPVQDVFLLAAECNAAVIRQVYIQQQQVGGRVWLASPTALKTVPNAACMLVMRFQQLASLPASMGGWHAMTDADAVIYDLHHLLKNNSQQNELTELAMHDRLTQHPAWKLWSFMPTLSLTAFARLLTTIGDPRWFVCPEHPTRDGRLNLYLGIHPDVLRKQHDTAKMVRLRNVLNTWKAHAAPDGVAPEDLPPSNFVYRRYAQYRDQDRVKAQIRASQHFINFVRQTWLASQSTQHGMLSVDSIFWESDEIVAFKAWIKRHWDR